MIEILDAALAGAEQPATPDELDLHLPICTASLPLAAAAQFVAPPLLPAAAVVLRVHVGPDVQGGAAGVRRGEADRRRRARRGRDGRLPGDHVDLPRAPSAAGASASAASSSSSPATGRRSCCSNAFGKQPRYAWLCRDGTEVQVPTDRLEKGDVDRRPHRRGRPGRRARGGRHGPDRPARPDRRVDAGREGGRRPGLRLDAARRGRDPGQRSRCRAARRLRPGSARSSAIRPATR